MVTSRSRLSVLTLLPCPLLPPQRTGLSGSFRNPAAPARRQPRDIFEDSYRRCQEHLIPASDFSSHPGEAMIFAREHGLAHLCFNLYYPAHREATPLLRAAALYECLGRTYTGRGRVSRQSAAWVWGYLPSLPPILHIDFDRTLRLNVTRARQHNIETHQVRVLAYDYIQLGLLRVTTPLRTVIDLLLHVQGQETDRLIGSMLDDPRHNCSADRVHETMDMMTYVRHKSQALDRLNRIARGRLNRYS